MRVLRNNKDSLLAVLEAFVHDPLLNWSERIESDKETEDLETTSTKTMRGPAGGASLIGMSAMYEAQLADPKGAQQARNKRALEVIERVRDKLTGHDFDVSWFNISSKKFLMDLRKCFTKHGGRI